MYWNQSIQIATETSKNLMDQNRKSKKVLKFWIFKARTKTRKKAPRMHQN